MLLNWDSPVIGSLWIQPAQQLNLRKSLMQLRFWAMGWSTLLVSIRGCELRDY